ncbi:MAG: TonB-dependent receptor, partial [Nitrospirae bacterium]
MAMAGTPAAAGGEGDLPLGQVVVTATRTEKAGLEVPAQVEVVTGKDIQERRLSRTVPEALTETPGVMVQKTSRGQGSPYVRGFTGFRNLLLIDGIRLNNAVFRDGPNQYWSTVDPLTVQRLEVVKGPASVLYGSDAVGATVNALTRTVVPGQVERWAAPRLYARYASAEDAVVARAEVAGGRGPVAWLAGTSWKDFGDVRGGREVGLQPATGYGERDGDVKLVWAVSPEVRLTLAHQQVAIEDAWRTHKTVQGISWHGTEVGSDKVRSFDQDRRLTYLQLHGRDPLPGVARLTASLSWQDQVEQQTRIKSNDERRRKGFDVGSLGLWFQAESDTALGYLTYGASWYRDNVSSFEQRFNPDGSLKAVKIQGNVADDAVYDLAGLFLQDDLDLGGRLDLILGGRYTYAHARAGRFADPLTGEARGLSDRWDEATGSLRLLYQALPGRLHLYAGLSQAFRAPNLSDLTSSIDTRSGEQEVPATDLDPERFLVSEAGVKLRAGPVEGQLGYYYTWIDGMIVRAPTGRLTEDGEVEVTKLNSGDGFVQGVEASARVRLGRGLIAYGDLAWVEGEVDGYPDANGPKVRDYLSRLAPTTGHLGLRWEPRGGRGWLEGLVTVAGEADRLSARDRADTQRIPPGGTPGYVTVTLRGGLAVSERLHLSAAVENLTDEDYRIHGSGQNEPGTNVVLAVDWR